MDGELFGQVVIFTGAGRGIGRAVGVELAAAGARLVLVSRTRADLERTAEEIGEDRATVIAVYWSGRSDLNRRPPEPHSRRRLAGLCLSGLREGLLMDR